MKKPVEMVGAVYGRLTVLALTNERRHGKLVYLVGCECGTALEVVGQSLRNGVTRSCGCFRSDLTVARQRTHGLTGCPEYRVWRAVINRCTNPRVQSYPRYGGAGVRVCSTWRRSFAEFYLDMGVRPSSGHSIDRINPFGNYEPANCRWATLKEQATNKRSHWRNHV